MLQGAPPPPSPYTNQGIAPRIKHLYVDTFMAVEISSSFNPKEAGSFDPISQPGGVDSTPPPRISAAERQHFL